MIVVKGRYNGKVVVLDEPAPVEGEARVTVTFPEPGDSPDAESELRREYWDNARETYLRYAGIGSEEVLRQRGRFDVTPSGLPAHMPTDQEWQERADRIRRLLKQWQSEEPSDDLAAREELENALRENPVRFREFKPDE